MEFYVMAKSYNCYGGHSSLSPIGDFLLIDAPDFGDAIAEIAVTLHFPHSGPPTKTLEELCDEHNTHRGTLPKITFRRARKKVEIDVASELMDGRDWKPSPRLSLSLFTRGVDEIVQALALMRRRLKSADSFDLDAFVAHCEAARGRIPGSEDALQELGAELKVSAQAKLDAMSPWEKLGIDWGDFHPEARDVLDDPFFWDCSNDFSPNGNDTGADLLEAYRDWLRKHRDGQPIQFLERLAKQWGYTGIDGMDEKIQNEAAIGLAFADIKLRALCDGEAQRSALNSIERQRAEVTASSGWPHREERLRILAKIEKILRQTDNNAM